MSYTNLCFSIWYTTRADHVILPQCAWETRGARRSFPSLFRSETQQSESEHCISYRRRSPEEGVETATRPVRGNLEHKVENSWVVAYNPKLMRIFHCHMNVELCVSRVCGIKYLFKYSDRVTIEIVEETSRYIEIE